MDITKCASAGTMESSDVYVEIEPAENGITLDLQSVVQAQYGDAILAAVRDVLARRALKMPVSGLLTGVPWNVSSGPEWKLPSTVERVKSDAPCYAVPARQ